MQVPTDTITEEAFLLTELRYTEGQLHVQLGDLDEASRDAAACEGRTINQILSDMLEQESRYQETYRELLKCAPGERRQEEGFVGENEFERRRAETVALLEQAGERWPEELIETVRQHVMADRQHTTQIAECRKSWYEQQGPVTDQSQPLTSPESDNSVGAVN
jgi:hypothetical protein